MLWGFIAHDGRKCLQLQKVCGTLNSIKSLQILHESLLPEMFLGENCSKITLPLIMRSFQRLGFPKIDWNFSKTGHQYH